VEKLKIEENSTHTNTEEMVADRQDDFIIRFFLFYLSIRSDVFMGIFKKAEEEEMETLLLGYIESD
jgi:hypothetical protein